jgi:hypothetical protein
MAANLSESLGCPVIVENDANAAAIGELTVGNPEHLRDRRQSRCRDAARMAPKEWDVVKT